MRRIERPARLGVVLSALWLIAFSLMLFFDHRRLHPEELGSAIWTRLVETTITPFFFVVSPTDTDYVAIEPRLTNIIVTLLVPLVAIWILVGLAAQRIRRR